MSYLNVATPNHTQEYFSISTNGVELSDVIRNMEPVVNPAGLANLGATTRELNQGHEFCKNRYIDGKYFFDTYGRQVNQETVKYGTCPGDNPTIAMMRDQNIQRQQFPIVGQYSLNNVPYGLKM